ncbi:MAG: amino acid permease [Alphaproteobacteria bacterium]|nr:amino acid permease [Alphaproteobacteria bacterium]
MEKGGSSGKSKIGFWSLISIVISAQLGASIFLLPSQLAQFRTLGIFGWMIGGLGAILLTIVFSFLCIKTAKTGGPHIYAKMFFGEKIGFFTTWVFWCGSWACNPILIATAVNYLMSFVGDMSLSMKLTCEILMVLSLTWVNHLGIRTTGVTEMFLTVLKVLPLLVIPVFAFMNMNVENFSEMTPMNMSSSETIIKATILSFWGFVGLEGGTTPASVVHNPKRTIPLAIILGTAFVALISVINTISVFGIIPPAELENVGAPFAKIMVTLFGGAYDKLIGAITFVMCYGSLNAWIFFSGQIAKSAADENIFPAFFKKPNKHGAPGRALWTGTFGTIVILFLQKSPLFGDKIGSFLDMSVIIYILLYTMAVLAYLKFMKIEKVSSMGQLVITLLALAFCLLILVNSSLYDFSAAILLLLAGIPVYWRMKKSSGSSEYLSV